MSRNLDNSARLVFGLMGFFLLLFIVSVVLTTLGDDTIGANRVDVNAVADQIKAGNVTEINQRNGIEMIIYLKDKERLMYFRPNNTAMTDALTTAGITPEQLTGISFTSGDPSNTYSILGGVLRLVGLAGLGITAVAGYFQRRKQVLGSGRRLR
ncbi:MAG: hypothetical protein ABI970_02125 [Chloroflexota bacterium]